MTPLSPAPQDTRAYRSGSPVGFDALVAADRQNRAEEAHASRMQPELRPFLPLSLALARLAARQHCKDVIQ